MKLDTVVAVQVASFILVAMLAVADEFSMLDVVCIIIVGCSTITTIITAIIEKNKQGD